MHHIPGSVVCLILRTHKNTQHSHTHAHANTHARAPLRTHRQTCDSNCWKGKVEERLCKLERTVFFAPSRSQAVASGEVPLNLRLTCIPHIPGCLMWASLMWGITLFPVSISPPYQHPLTHHSCSLCTVQALLLLTFFSLCRTF